MSTSKLARLQDELATLIHVVEAGLLLSKAMEHDAFLEKSDEIAAPAACSAVLFVATARLKEVYQSLQEELDP